MLTVVVDNRKMVKRFLILMMKHFQFFFSLTRIVGLGFFL